VVFDSNDTEPVTPSLLSSQERVERALLAAVRQRLLDPDVEMGPTTPLWTVGLDSMAVMQLLLLIEECFGLWLPESGLTRENLTDVRSLAVVVAQHLEATGTPLAE
jgi:acyl carrier protein